MIRQEPIPAISGDAVWTPVDGFTGGVEQADDISVVVVTRPAASPAP